MRAFAIAVIAATACKPDLVQSVDPRGDLDGSKFLTAPPPGSSREASLLYQQLYAGEHGPQLAKAGQRLRILAWLREMDFTEKQLRELRAMARLVKSRESELLEYRDDVGRNERKNLGPIYADLLRRLAVDEEPAPADLKRIADDLRAARETIYSGKDPRTHHYEVLGQTIADLRPWLSGLAPEQQKRLSLALFFLGHRLGPFVNPGDYGALIGAVWNANDFETLRRAMLEPHEDQHLDIGGLWSIGEAGHVPPRQLVGPQVQAIAVMALQEEELTPAIDILLEGADPLDGLALPRD